MAFLKKCPNRRWRALNIRPIDDYGWICFDECPPPDDLQPGYSVVVMVATDSGRRYVMADNGSANRHETTHWRAIKHPEDDR